MQVQEFIDKLVESIRTKDLFNNVLEKMKDEDLKWDVVSRRLIGSFVEELFQECFPTLNVKECVAVEGKGMLRRPSPIFGSYGQFPDIRIEKPWKLAIELDHAAKNAGSRYKMALVKAALNVLSGDWDYCVVLFHNHSNKKLGSYLQGETEQKILRFYESELKTKVYLFE
ncbi:MAG: hypothetical protein QW279_05785 [Candidatus Jordarchaeaceae archaeon]